MSAIGGEFMTVTKRHNKGDGLFSVYLLYPFAGESGRRKYYNVGASFFLEEAVRVCSFGTTVRMDGEPIRCLTYCSGISHSAPGGGFCSKSFEIHRAGERGAPGLR